MSKIYKLAVRYYNTILSTGDRLWNAEQLGSLVAAGKLTPDEYKSITGTNYKEV